MTNGSVEKREKRAAGGGGPETSSIFTPGEPFPCWIGTRQAWISTSHLPRGANTSLF